MKVLRVIVTSIVAGSYLWLSWFKFSEAMTRMALGRDPMAVLFQGVSMLMMIVVTRMFVTHSKVIITVCLVIGALVATGTVLVYAMWSVVVSNPFTLAQAISSWIALTSFTYTLLWWVATLIE